MCDRAQSEYGHSGQCHVATREDVEEGIGAPVDETVTTLTLAQEEALSGHPSHSLRARAPPSALPPHLLAVEAHDGVSTIGAGTALPSQHSPSSLANHQEARGGRVLTSMCLCVSIVSVCGQGVCVRTTVLLRLPRLLTCRSSASPGQEPPPQTSCLSMASVCDRRCLRSRSCRPATSIPSPHGRCPNEHTPPQKTTRADWAEDTSIGGAGSRQPTTEGARDCAIVAFTGGGTGART